jgi:hypothetical protein
VLAIGFSFVALDQTPFLISDALCIFFLDFSIAAAGSQIRKPNKYKLISSTRT